MITFLRTFIMACVLAAPVWAADTAPRYSCSFVHECLDVEGCQDTDYSLDFSVMPIPGDDNADLRTILVSDIAGEYRAVPRFNQFNDSALSGFVSQNSDGDEKMLSFDENGAFYSLHLLSAELHIFYKGSCQEDTP